MNPWKRPLIVVGIVLIVLGLALAAQSLAQPLKEMRPCTLKADTVLRDSSGSRIVPAGKTVQVMPMAEGFVKTRGPVAKAALLVVYDETGKGVTGTTFVDPNDCQK